MSQQQKQTFGLRVLHALRNASTSVIAPENKSHLKENEQNASETSLKLENLLLEEFKHESSHSIQNLQDRSVTYNLYFLLIGISVSSLGLTYQFILSLSNYLLYLLLIVFLLLGLIHFLFLVRFIELEKRMRDIFRNMNVIREVYIDHFQKQVPYIKNVLPTYNLYFYPRSTSRPFIGYIFMSLGSFYFAGAAFVGIEIWLGISGRILLFFPLDIRPYIIGLAIGVVVFFLNLLYQRRSLGNQSKKR